MRLCYHGYTSAHSVTALLSKFVILRKCITHIPFHNHFSQHQHSKHKVIFPIFVCPCMTHSVYPAIIHVIMVYNTLHYSFTVEDCDQFITINTWNVGIDFTEQKLFLCFIIFLKFQCVFHELMNKYQACLYSVECISHGDFKYGLEISQSWIFLTKSVNLLTCRLHSPATWKALRSVLRCYITQHSSNCKQLCIPTQF